MKRKCKYFLLVCCSLVACKDEFEVYDPDIQVEISGNVFRGGEEVTFNFTGTADLSSFYSGEVFNDYDYIKSRVVAAGPSMLSFTTSVEFGTQSDQLSILLSNGLNDNYSFEHVEDTEWVDITSKFTLASSPTFVNSGEVDISPYYEPGKKLYVAFRYNVRDQGIYGAGRIWRIADFMLNTSNELGEHVLGNMQTANLQLVEEENPALAPRRSTINASRVQVAAHRLTPENTSLETRIWAISKGFEMGDIDFGPDKSIPIKGLADNRLEQFTHTYGEPGRYKAVFLATNANGKGSHSVIREFELTIVENQ